MARRMTKKRKEEIKKAEEQKKLLKLDLGCGQSKRDGFLGVDIAKVDGVDFVVDLFKFPWPWKDASVEEIFTSHFFEHVPQSIRPKFMDECYRILIPAGKMTVVVPYYSSMRAVQDYHHQWPPISETSFLYFNKNWLKANKLDHYPTHCDFDFTYGYAVGPYWAARAQEARDFAVQYHINSVADLQVLLTKR
jgi:SAM-dependent methyltransferase